MSENIHFLDRLKSIKIYLFHRKIAKHYQMLDKVYQHSGQNCRSRPQRTCARIQSSETFVEHKLIYC